MARGNQRENAREEAQKKLGNVVSRNGIQYEYIRQTC